MAYPLPGVSAPGARMAVEAEPSGAVTLAAVADRLAAVADVPVRLDDLDLHLGAGHGVATLEQRFDLAAERLGLDDLARAVLAAIALHDLAPELGSALAQLGPATAAGAATARAVGWLLAGPGVSVADVLVALGSGERLRGLGAVHFADSPDGTALADRPLVLADRLATMLLGAAIDDPAAGQLRRVERSPLPFGRAEAIDRLAGLLGVAGTRRAPIAVHGPDAQLAVCAASGRGALCVAVAALAEAAVARDAVLAATLEDRTLVVDRFGDLAPADRATLPDRLRRLPGGGRAGALGRGPGVHDRRGHLLRKRRVRDAPPRARSCSRTS